MCKNKPVSIFLIDLIAITYCESTLGLEKSPKNVQKRACIKISLESILGPEKSPKNVQKRACIKISIESTLGLKNSPKNEQK
jgi:hypothetical protein